MSYYAIRRVDTQDIPIYMIYMLLMRCRAGGARCCLPYGIQSIISPCYAQREMMLREVRCYVMLRERDIAADSRSGCYLLCCIIAATPFFFCRRYDATDIFADCYGVHVVCQ